MSELPSAEDPVSGLSSAEDPVSGLSSAEDPLSGLSSAEDPLSGLTPQQVQAMAAAIGLPLAGEDLAEVTHRLNGLLEALQPLDELPLGDVEPLPILPDDGAP